MSVVPTNVSEEHAASITHLPENGGTIVYNPPKCWYPHTWLRSVITHKVTLRICTTVNTSNVKKAENYVRCYTLLTLFFFYIHLNFRSQQLK